MNTFNIYITKTENVLNFLLLPNDVNSIEKLINNYCPNKISFTYDTFPSDIWDLLNNVYLALIKKLFIGDNQEIGFNFIYHL